MTRVLRLELEGFKSFGDKTQIPFGEDFNCILGPNGSGKSNIIDAICFVLGKISAKSMRAEKTANLIYNGGKSGNPAKQGRVTIVFDNTKNVLMEGVDELTVSRIVKKSGSSKYMMNGEKTTRQHIQETLAKAKIYPDGYNIILQGDVVKLVEMSSKERREIIEEIAGINIYEDKKQKALRELNRVQEKIEEGNIVLKEREDRLNELKKDKDKAQEFKDLKNKLKRNKATLLQHKISNKEEEKGSYEEDIESHQEKKQKVQDNIREHKQSIEELKEKIEEINKEVESQGETKQVEIHKEIEEIKVDIATKKQKIEDLEESLETNTKQRSLVQEKKQEIDEKASALISKKEEYEQKEQELTETIEDIQNELEGFKEQHAIGSAAEIDQQIEEIDEKLEENQKEIDTLRKEQQDILRKKDKKETKLEGLDEKLEKMRELQEQNAQDLQRLRKLKKEFKQKSVALSKALAEDSNLSGRQGTVRSKLYKKKEEHAKLEAKTARIRERISGSKAIKGILDLNKNGVHGLLSELGTVDKKYAQALEVAAGSRTKSIVTETDKVASSCISYLKKNKLGYASFIPLNKIKAKVIKQSLRNIKQSGVIGLAIDLVEYDQKYDKAFRYALGNTLIVKDIPTARKVGIGRVRMITLDGDKVERSGAMQGGHRRKRRSLGFSQQKNSKKLKELAKEISDLESVEQKISKKRSENEDRITTLRNKKAELEGEIIKLEKSLRLDGDESHDTEVEKDDLQQEINELEDKLFSVQNKINSVNKDIALLKQKKNGLRDKLSKLRSSEIVAQLSSYEQQIEEKKEEKRDIEKKKDRLVMEHEDVLGSKRNDLIENLEKLDQKVSEHKEQLQDLKEHVEELEETLEEKEKSQQEFYDQFKELFNKRNELQDNVKEHESKILELNNTIKDHSHKINVMQMEKAKIETTLQSLQEEYEPLKHIPRFEEKEIDTIKEEIEKAKDMMDNIGAVNMKALEIYDSVQEKYSELLDKKERLQEEKESVLLMINEVDTKKKDLFMKTFNVVNHNFQQIFQTLSSKGKAMLELEDEDDPFDGGMNIKVKLSGKKYMDIRSLSGGEKTMTALAFIFAVQEHEPAAFYVLDEVDAALDTRNSDRLARLVQEYSNRSQYIMISHNDNVIQEADALYGVSMTKKGVSKVTTMEI